LFIKNKFPGQEKRPHVPETRKEFETKAFIAATRSVLAAGQHWKGKTLQEKLFPDYTVYEKK
jgi:hypothetical protein